MDEASIRTYVASTFAGVDVFVASKENGAPEVAWGDTFFIYDPDRNLPIQNAFRSRRSSRRTTESSTTPQI